MAARSAVLGIDRGGFHFGVTKIFENVSFQLDDARTALVGENGAGKSTLLKCLAGELELASGSIVKSRGSRVGIVPQEIPSNMNDVPVREFLERALPADARDDTWKVDVLLDDLKIPPELAERNFGDPFIWNTALRCGTSVSFRTVQNPHMKNRSASTESAQR